MSQSATAFLEYLQRSIYERLPARFRPQPTLTDAVDIGRSTLERMIQKKAAFMSPDELASTRERMLEEFDKEVARLKLPTPYEDPAGYIIMQGLRSQIEEAAKDLAIEVPEKPVIGTLPTGRVNAMAIAVPGGSEKVVVFESQLFAFALLLSKPIVCCMPFTETHEGGFELSFDVESVQSDLAADDEVVNRFREVLIAYLLTGMPGNARPWLVDEPYAIPAGLLIRALELFVMGHEYGHIINGHLRDCNTVTTSLHSEAVDEVALNWEQEIEADVTGLSLTLRAMQNMGVDLSLSFWGADFFFSCVEILQRSKSLATTGKINTSALGSHPPPELRRSALRDALKRDVPDELSRNALLFAEAMQAIVEAFWTKCKPQLIELHERKVELAPVWSA